MALHPSNVQFNDNKLWIGKKKGHPEGKTRGTMDGPDLNIGFIIVVKTKNKDIVWNGEIESMKDNKWHFEVTNTYLEREIKDPHGPLTDPLEDVDVTVETPPPSPPDCGETVTAVSIEPIP